MNVFFLARDPRIAARMHCDKHVMKMILEYAQLMMGAWWEMDPEYAQAERFWRKTHINHPAAKWVRSSLFSYAWVFSCWSELLDLYEELSGRVHAASVFQDALAVCPPGVSDSLAWIEPPQCMPECSKTDDPVEAYRRYYLMDKARFATWRERPTPYWWDAAGTTKN